MGKTEIPLSFLIGRLPYTEREFALKDKQTDAGKLVLGLEYW